MTKINETKVGLWDRFGYKDVCVGILTSKGFRKNGVMLAEVPIRASFEIPRIEEIIGQHVEKSGDTIHLSTTGDWLSFPVRHASQKHIDMDLIKRGMQDLIKIARAMSCTTFLLPPLGGLTGKFGWKYMKKELEPIDIPDNIIFALGPAFTPQEEEENERDERETIEIPDKFPDHILDEKEYKEILFADERATFITEEKEIISSVGFELTKVMDFVNRQIEDGAVTLSVVAIKPENDSKYNRIGRHTSDIMFLLATFDSSGKKLPGTYYQISEKRYSEYRKGFEDRVIMSGTHTLSQIESFDIQQVAAFLKEMRENRVKIITVNFGLGMEQIKPYIIAADSDDNAFGVLGNSVSE